jgi:protein SCO1/2
VAAVRSVLAAALLVLAGVLPAGGSAAQPDRTVAFDPPRALPAFTLTDPQGRAAGSAALRGQVTLVFFGFTQCPDVCPTTLLRLRNLLRSSPDFAAVRGLMISVDGERDDPAALRAFLGRSGPAFTALTGPPEVVRPVARAFSATFYKQPPAGPDGRYTVDHSSQVYLVDRAGRLRAAFFNAPEESMVAALRAVMREPLPAR